MEKVDAAALRPSSREARIAGGESGRIQKARYSQWKAFAVEHEADNYSKLFVIHEKDNWWKMVGHSAIMFHYEVSKWAGIKSKLVPDTDYDTRSEEGVVNIRDIDQLDAKLMAIKVNSIDIKPDYRVYNIGKKYTKADIEALKQTKAIEWAKVNKIILPREVFPALFMSLRELLTRLYFSTRSLDAYARETIAAPMFEKVVGLVREYSLIANKVGIRRTEYLDEVDAAMQWVTAQMTAISELRLMEAERIYQVLRAAEKVRRDVEQCQPKKT